jgi:hypothetical protein
VYYGYEISFIGGNMSVNIRLLSAFWLLAFWLSAFWLLAFLLLCGIAACASAPETREPPVTVEFSTPKPTATDPAARMATAPATTLLPTATGSLERLSPAIQMNMGRAAHTATLLADGRVLIAGGFRQEGTREISIASAELYDPETNTFIPRGELNEPRSGHTATLLPDGQVLIAGGWGASGITATAELYDPQSGEFRYTASLAAPRAGMTATLLPDGLVLIAGGESATNTPQPVAELYDPATDTFNQKGSLNQGRYGHTATLLMNGKVLLIGGNVGHNTVLISAEVYDPASEEFTLTGKISMVRHKHAAVLMQDGNVLVIGGSDQRDWSGKYSSAEIYDPLAGTFSRTADLTAERFKLADAAVLLDDGNVLVGGGNRLVELFEVNNQRFIPVGELDNDYYFAVLTRLIDGRVLITGGYDSSIQPSDKAWIFD